ncbi:hypothetical protein MOD48_18810 [Bacillus spizizenii]|uniref:Uncharacterized protein n=2 Tax=Bacillus spizizenii TaxID=96241 RepID=A0A9Q4DQS4_BACSC|nr:hypothetical protein [Bacillus spizizenii]KFI01560.1 hypothetical protein JN25_20290 [Bacillus sp. BSC154]MDU7574774.1 hypothetical protein [Bacillus subtilis]ADM37868.1 hypothetical protein BSUW23_09110 [Bacillus spizizenii str. W23]AJW87215.1 hypothetical protein BIS30_19720 [Bacillus spizizenii]EFG92866.1 hypothetical protein BSU6633_07801 [Bacillus spizizenii ATCC 6633 = JCM 2499]
MYEKENTVREWKVYLFVFSFMMVCAVAIVIFEPKILFSQIVLRGFDAFISFVLLANVLFFWRRNKRIAYVSGVLAIINLIMVISLV